MLGAEGVLRNSIPIKISSWIPEYTSKELQDPPSYPGFPKCLWKTAGGTFWQMVVLPKSDQGCIVGYKQYHMEEDNRATGLRWSP